MQKQCKKAATSNKSGVNEGIMAPLLVALNDTHTTNQRRNLRRATRKSDDVCTKNKSSVASPPSPEDDKRKRSSEESIEEDQKKCLPKEIPVSRKGLTYSDDDDYIDKVAIYSDTKFW
jgi:transcriptional regulator of met regulon